MHELLTMGLITLAMLYTPALVIFIYIVIEEGMR